MDLQAASGVLDQWAAFGIEQGCAESDPLQTPDHGGGDFQRVAQYPRDGARLRRRRGIAIKLHARALR